MSGFIDVQQLNAASIQLGFPFRNDKDLKTTFSEIDTNGKGRLLTLTLTLTYPSPYPYPYPSPYP